MSADLTPICPCDQVVFPVPIVNLPGQAFVSYRTGTYAGFRGALLRSNPDEVELAAWRPTAGDLALQLVEWFAYLGDILTFYNEQAANNSYLATAFLPGSVERLVRVLGYRPRPGIGAKGVVGAIFAPNASGAVTIPVGFAIQSKPDPAPPQVFELDSTKPILVPAVGELPVHIEPASLDDGLTIPEDQGVLLEGVVTGLKAEDVVMIAPVGQLAAPDSTMVIVSSVAVEADARGRKNTRVKFVGEVTITGDPHFYGLFRSTQSMGAFVLASLSTADDLHLASLARSLRAGDPVVIPDDPKVKAVSAYTEQIAFIDGSSASDPKLPIPHSVISLEDLWPDGTRTSVDVSTVSSIQFGFRRIATLIKEPVPSPVSTQEGLTLTPDALVRDDVVAYGASTLVVGGDGNGVVGQVTSDQTESIEVSVDEPRDLTLPLSMLFATIPVSRGKTVSKEILGSGDATIPGQVFTLQKSPLTYFPGPDPSFPSSTLHVWVNGVEWKEVQSFYGQSPGAQVFVTRETVDQKTQVIFGDGVNGARLPSGKDNVVATYRYGSGRQSPPVGSLTNILKPVPGLRSIRNPVAVSGGDDPQPPDKIREYAPASVLTFGRAISASDYEAIAAQAPAVTRAKAYYSWDAARQRALVKVYVGDDDAAVLSARGALDSARDRNLPLQVIKAGEVPLALSFSLVVDSRYDADAVKSEVSDALLDPDTGLFSPKRLLVGERLYESRVVATCLGVPGAVAVHHLRMGQTVFTFRRFHRIRPIFGHLPPESPVVIDPGEGGFCTLSQSNLSISTEAADG